MPHFGISGSPLVLLQKLYDPDTASVIFRASRQQQCHNWVFNRVLRFTTFEN